MATFSDARAVYGLSATGTPTSTNVSGSVQVGVNQTQVRLADSDVAFSMRAVVTRAADSFVVDCATGSISGTTAFVAGAQQIETATVIAASGITGSGNATVTVTASGMTGSPKAISVALTTAEHTTATLIATAIAAALNADADYSVKFIATSSGADVITKRKSLWSGTPDIFPANDSTLNIAIANGTCTGITTAATSANTTAGVETTGTKVYDGDGKDFEGENIVEIVYMTGLLIENESAINIQSTGSADDLFSVPSSGQCLFVSNESLALDGVYTFSASSAPFAIKITVTGKSA